VAGTRRECLLRSAEQIDRSHDGQRNPDPSPWVGRGSRLGYSLPEWHPAGELSPASRRRMPCWDVEVRELAFATPGRLAALFWLTAEHGLQIPRDTFETSPHSLPEPGRFGRTSKHRGAERERREAVQNQRLGPTRRVITELIENHLNGFESRRPRQL
jgi:hypothetical protein